MNSLRTISILTAVIASCFTAVSADNPVVRNPATTNRFSAAPSNGQFAVWNSSTKVWDLTSAAPAVVTDALTNASSKDFGISVGTLYSQNLSANSRWVYFDDFNEPSSVPGLLPDAPTGHRYTLLTQYGNTNHIVQTNGYWSMGNTGAVYRSVHFRTNAQYGPMVYPNSFGGNFRYRKSTNGTVDGVERNLTFILSTNADFVAKPPFLHVSVGASGFHVGRELSATNLLYIHPLPGNRNLQHLTNYNFSITIISNVLIAEIAGYQFMTYDESLSTTYKGLNVATWESTGTHTNEAWGEWDSAWAGYSTPTESQLWGGPFKFGSNWVLNGINFESGGEQRYSVKHESDLFQIYDTIDGSISFSVSDTTQDVTLGAASSGNITIQRPFSALGEATMSGGIDLNNGVTASRVLMADINGKVTNVVSSSPSTEYVKADGTVGTPSGGSGGTNFSGVVITNAIERTVWRAGSTTNLTVPWGTTNRIVWHPASNAGLQMNGTPGGGTNEQIIHVMICLTNSGITSVVMPTNEMSGLAPFFLTAPSTNEFDFVYNGDKFYIVSYQTPTTGNGQTVVVNTNPVIWNPTIGVNGASNTFNITSPSEGQVIGVHSSSGGVTVLTNMTVSGGSSGPTTNAPPQVLAINTGTGSTNITLDMLALGPTNYVRATLTANAGLRVTNVVDGKEITLEIVQDSTGNRTLAQSSAGGAPLRFGSDITGFALTTNGTYIDKIRLHGSGTNAQVVGMLRGYAP